MRTLRFTHSIDWMKKTACDELSPKVRLLIESSLEGSVLFILFFLFLSQNLAKIFARSLNRA